MALSSPALVRNSGSGEDVGRRVEVAVVAEAPVIIHGLRSMLLPYDRSIGLTAAGLEPAGPGPVDITLFDPVRDRDGSVVDSLLGDADRGRVVVYSVAPSPDLLAAMLHRGCAGFVDKGASAAELVERLTSLAEGTTVPPGCAPEEHDWCGREYGLSRRESQVVGLITLGLTNDDISAEAYLSINTVKSYIRSAYRKLGVTRRVEAVRWGMEQGMDRPTSIPADGPSGDGGAPRCPEGDAVLMSLSC